jgi:hypothetical protein
MHNTRFVVEKEEAYTFRPRHAPCARWPFAGMELTPERRAHFGLPDSFDSGLIVLPGTSQAYVLTGKYLIPYYRKSNDAIQRDNISVRREELIIDRARQFINNAQPELGVIRTRAQIEESLARWQDMPESSHAECAQKAGHFKLLVGAMITRMETLGRVINQRNTEGVLIEYDDMKNAEGEIPEERIEELKAEFKKYYEFLNRAPIMRMLPTILFTDMKVDRDGVLIDLIREIGKPIRMQEGAGEEFVRDRIVSKIGDAIASIDELHGMVARAMTEEPTKTIFENSIKKYTKEHGALYGIHSPEDVLTRLEEYASVCRARCCIRGDDSAYDEVFAKKSMLNGLFNGENGLLQSMRREGRGKEAEISELRSLLTRGLKLMSRTAYTRTPCNANAPEPWIPNLTEDASAMEQFMANQLLSPHDRTRAKRVMQAAEGLPSNDHQRFIHKKFNSVGWLEDDFESLRDKLSEKARKAEPARS